MSELSLHIAPSPELLNGAANHTTSPLKGPVCAGRNSSDAAGPAEDSGAPNPFAALLSGVLQGAQPAPPATAPEDPGTVPGDPPADGQTAANADALALLALPAIAMPLPAAPGVTADAGKLRCNSLPVPGNSLPLDPAAGLQASVPLSRPTTDRGATPDGDAISPPATAVAGNKPPQISLADLALSRPLEIATTGGDAAGRVNADPMAVVLASRAPARRDALASHTESAASLLPPPVTTESATGTPGAAPAAAGAGKNSLRLTAAELLRGALAPDASGDRIANQVAVQSAAFAAGSDSGTALAGAAPPAGSAAPDSASSALLGRLGNTGLPPLQPQGDAGAFAAGLADRLLTLGGPGSHSARLKLHPEHLGKLDVEISMDDGVAQVWFGTTTSQARDAIESSLPRLRELFAEQGIQLARTHIDAGGAQMSNAGSGQQRHMRTGSYGTEVPAWQLAAITGRGGADAIANSAPAGNASVRLLDVWA